MTMTKERFHAMFCEDLEMLKDGLMYDMTNGKPSRERTNVLLEVLGVLDSKKRKGEQAMALPVEVW